MRARDVVGPSNVVARLVALRSELEAAGLYETARAVDKGCQIVGYEIPAKIGKDIGEDTEHLWRRINALLGRT